MLNSDKIKNFSSNRRIFIASISLIIAILSFVGSAVIYNLETKIQNGNFEEKIKPYQFNTNEFLVTSSII
jgi:hypothetical protein